MESDSTGLSRMSRSFTEVALNCTHKTNPISGI